MIAVGSLTRWESKCWGRTRLCRLGEFADVPAIREVLDRWGDRCTVHELYVNEGWCCSRHWHWKWNRFVVLSGRIAVVKWKAADSGHCKRFELGPGELFDVATGVIHRFEVMESGRVLEAYWPGAPATDVDPDDICRLDVGGRV